MQFRMPFCVGRLARRVSSAVVRACVWLRREAWPAHVQRVATNPAYAAAMAAILAGLLGLSPAREVIATLLGAALGAYRKGHGETSPTGALDPWNPL